MQQIPSKTFQTQSGLSVFIYHRRLITNHLSCLHNLPLYSSSCLWLGGTAVPPLHRQPGSLEIKAQLSRNYLPSPLRLTSALVSKEQTCQQKPADQKFRQHGGGGDWGAEGHTYQTFIYPHSYICLCTGVCLEFAWNFLGWLLASSEKDWKSATSQSARKRKKKEENSWPPSRPFLLFLFPISWENIIRTQFFGWSVFLGRPCSEKPSEGWVSSWCSSESGHETGCEAPLGSPVAGDH